MSERQSIRVLIADMHPVVRMGLMALIQSDPSLSVVGQAKNGREAVALFRQERPDVLLTDLTLPELDGIEAIRTIRSEFPRASVVVLTARDRDQDISQTVGAGARAYLPKETPTAELLEALRAAYHGQRRIPKAIADRLAACSLHADLSGRELDVLRLVAEGRSNKQIGTTLQICEGTVKAHVTHILEKLGASDRTHAVTTALRRGLIQLA